MLVHSDSLSETVNAVSEVFFNGRTITASERTKVAHWIAGRQGLSGAYANTFAGFEDERARGIQLFTGERVTSASARHILGEETCRVLRQLNVNTPTARNALDRADDGLIQCMLRAENDPRFTNPGIFCCGKCSVGMWRNLLTGGIDRQEERLRQGIKHLTNMRDGKGRWRRFPFWYTMLALSEADDVPGAATEIRYAGKALKAASSTNRSGGSASAFAQRRRAVAALAFARI